MDYCFTPGAQRALDHGAEWAGCEDSGELEGSALLMGLLAEPECRAALMLAAREIDAAAVRRRWAGGVF